MANSLIYYYLFKTAAPDGSAFFGIHGSPNAQWNADGQPVDYCGSGPKLAAKARQFGLQRLSVDTLYTTGDYNDAKRRLDNILTPATLADPRCLNMPREQTNAKISEALKDKPKSEEHKSAISKAMEGNSNAVKEFTNTVPTVIPISPVSPQELTEIVEDMLHTVWIHNKTTGEEMQLPVDEEVITGFELGRLPLHLRKKFKGKTHVQPMSDDDRARMIRD
jgi:hypothetical protein